MVASAWEWLRGKKPLVDAFFALPVVFFSVPSLLVGPSGSGAGLYVLLTFALAGPQLNIAPILLFSQIRGDVLGSPGLGYALAFGMIVITGLANALYLWLRARTERWQK